MNMIDSEHIHQSTKTKRNEHDRNEIRIPSKGSAGLELHFQLLRRHFEAPHRWRFRRYPFIAHYYCWPLIFIILFTFGFERAKGCFVQIVHYFHFFWWARTRCIILSKWTRSWITPPDYADWIQLSACGFLNGWQAGRGYCTYWCWFIGMDGGRIRAIMGWFKEGRSSKKKTCMQRKKRSG